MTIQDAIKDVVAGRNLSIEQAKQAFTQIMSGSATDSQIAALIVALRMKGETPEEITGAASVMREKATQVLPSVPDHLIDTCGTGGDGSNSFNISTTTAFVAAGAGATVAKHGNRCVSSKSGSADVLEALGVNIAISPEVVISCLNAIGIAFLFAPALHTAMKYAIGPRKEIGVRTIFNVLGPLTNPAQAKRQLLGVFSEGLTQTLATVLKNLGSQKAFVVYGMEGLDEISIAGSTRITELCDGKITNYSISPDHFGISPAPRSAIAGGTPAENAVIIRDVLSGRKGPHRDVVVLNAGFAIAAAGLSKTPAEGIALAQKSIDSGAAHEKLEKLIAITSTKP
jgi:anthranilate phosphoribosyltransferase